MNGRLNGEPGPGFGPSVAPSASALSVIAARRLPEDSRGRTPLRFESSTLGATREAFGKATVANSYCLPSFCAYPAIGARLIEGLLPVPRLPGAPIHSAQ